MFCKKCGTELKDEWKVCPNCGEPVEKPKHKNKVIGIVAIVIVLGLVGIGIGIGRGQSKSNNKSTSTTTKEDNKSTKKNNKTKEEKSDTEITGDMHTDVENKLLYVNDDGQVTDKKGNVLDDYSYVEGMYVNADGLICYEKPAESEIDDRPEIEILKDKADPDKCDTDVVECGDSTAMGDDGDYFDEVILGAWYNDDGTPKADLFPEKIRHALSDTDMSISLDGFEFIDGLNYTIDDLKRETNPQGGVSFAKNCYGIIMQNIEKSKNSDGEIIYTGFDPCSNEFVVLHGDFKGVINEDDLLVFTKFKGLAEDDTVNFTGGYVQIINGRL